MSEKNEIGKYILGLDLGVQSIGWAIIPEKASANEVVWKKTLRLGTRCFDSGTGTEDDIQKGKDESKNIVRRSARGVRRNLWRRKRRLHKLFRLLQAASLLPATKDTPEIRQEMLNTLDIQLQEKYFTILGHTDQQVFAYKLRAIALDQKLSLHAFGRIIFQLAQRRGFLSNKKAITKKTNDKDDDEGKVKTGISDLDKAIKEGGFRTLGEYFASLDPEECRIRQRWTGRQMYRDELDLIWNTQAKYHKELNEKLMKEIEQAIFFQRPLKSQKSLIGHCALEKNKRNCPKADLHFQRFRYWQKIIDLKILRDGTNPEPLTSDEQDLLAKELDISGKLTFSEMRKILGFKKISAVKKNESETFWQVGRFNLEVDDDGEKELIGNKTAEKIYAILKEQWLQMSLDEQDTLVSVITQFASEKALAKRLVKKYHFTEYLAGELAKLQFEQGYSSISRQAIDKILPLMLEKRIPFKTAEKQIYGDIDHNNNIYDLLPPILTAVPSLKNPVVSRALTELRKVVNCIVREYGKPELIRIELARDMKKGRQEREKIFKDISEQEKKRKLAVKQLEENGIIAPNSRDILKFLLWQECDQKCPYTGKTITFQALFGESAQFDIEHIIDLLITRSPIKHSVIMMKTDIIKKI